MRPTHRSLAGLAIILAATSFPGFTAVAQTAIGTPDKVDCLKLARGCKVSPATIVVSQRHT